jgi:hypothetical protein
MEPFLGKESFPGPSVGLTAVHGSYAGQAYFNGCIAFCNWRKEDAAALLPAELELAENTSSAPEVHPVVFTFGEQTEGATIFGGMTFPMGVSYHEFAFAIPFVKHRRGRNLHTFVPRMYSSYFPATWTGNAHYGFGKEMAAMQWQDALFVVATAAGETLFTSAVESVGDWVSGRGCDLPNFAAMRAVFTLPIVGRRSDGTFVASYFGWDFDVAQVRPARATLSIVAQLTGGLTPQTYAGLDSGTFEIRRMIWRLGRAGRRSRVGVSGRVPLQVSRIAITGQFVALTVSVPSTRPGRVGRQRIATRYERGPAGAQPRRALSIPCTSSEISTVPSKSASNATQVSTVAVPSPTSTPRINSSTATPQSRLQSPTQARPSSGGTLGLAGSPQRSSSSRSRMSSPSRSRPMRTPVPGGTHV